MKTKKTTAQRDIGFVFVWGSGGECSTHPSSAPELVGELAARLRRCGRASRIGRSSCAVGCSPTRSSGTLWHEDGSERAGQRLEARDWADPKGANGRLSARFGRALSQTASAGSAWTSEVVPGPSDRSSTLWSLRVRRRRREGWVHVWSCLSRSGETTIATGCRRGRWRLARGASGRPCRRRWGRRSGVRRCGAQRRGWRVSRADRWVVGGGSRRDARPAPHRRAGVAAADRGRAVWRASVQLCPWCEALGCAYRPLLRRRDSRCAFLFRCLDFSSGRELGVD
jgi:hypothetical protein